MRFSAILVFSMLLGTRAAAQELGFLTAALGKIHNITLSADAGTLLDYTNLAVDPDACTLGSICGMSAEVLFDVTSPRGTHVDLALGASYFRGFREKNNVPVEIRGSVRSFPTISAYITKEGHRRDAGIDPYFGVSFGISDLWNVQAYDSARKEYSIKGQTFDYGISGGVSMPITGSLALFAEGSYRRRRFASVDWSADVVPTGGPKSFNFDAVLISLGAQVSVNADDATPSYVGVWALTRVDGKELPVTFEQHRSSSGSERDEVTSGTLTIQPTHFDISLVHRTVSFDDGGRQIAVTQTAPRQLAVGTATINKGQDVLSLSPSGATDVRAYRTDREISVELGGHVLQFRRLGSAGAP